MSSKSPSQIESGTIATIVGPVGYLTAVGIPQSYAERIIGQKCTVVSLTVSGRYRVDLVGDLSGLFLAPESLSLNPVEEAPEIEESVILQIRARRDAGRAKYQTSMERQDLTLVQWLQHLQEELLDAAIYVEKLKREGGAK